jgi:uncharacterized protein (TIGR03083 family)
MTGGDETDALLREQWAVLRAWLDDVDVGAHGDLQSVLPGWTVRELIAHLGYGVEMVTALRPAGPGVQPLTFGAYVVQYQPAAPWIEQATREVAATMTDVLSGIDELATAAWDALDQLRTPVVLARRGPLSRSDYLVTRLLEVVVHADDLHRSLPCALQTPVTPQARAVVAHALAAAYEERSGTAPGVADQARWIRLATGRIVSDDPHLPLL